MVERERLVRSSTVFSRMMRSVLDIGRSHFDIGSPSTEHNENFSTQRNGEPKLEFEQIIYDLRGLKHLWTFRDLYGQTARQPSVLQISFALDKVMTDTRGFATAPTDFRASGAGTRANRVQNASLWRSFPVSNLHEARDFDATESSCPQ